MTTLCYSRRHIVLGLEAVASIKARIIAGSGVNDADRQRVFCAMADACRGAPRVASAIPNQTVLGAQMITRLCITAALVTVILSTSCHKHETPRATPESKARTVAASNRASIRESPPLRPQDHVLTHMASVARDTVPVMYSPLAIQRYNDRKATLQARVDSGELSREQYRVQLTQFALDLIARQRKRADHAAAEKERGNPKG